MPLYAGIGVWKVGANVTERKGAEHGVAHHMQQHIGVAVAHGTLRVGNHQPSDHQILAFRKLVNVVTVPNAEAHSPSWANSAKSENCNRRLKRRVLAKGFCCVVLMR